MKLRVKDNPEERIRDEILKLLKLKDWLTKITHGNIFSMGFPDIYAAHRRYGQRWIEVKNPRAYSFTPAQVEFFPLLYAHGVGVWILTAGTEEEYKKLFDPCNFFQYMMMKT